MLNCVDAPESAWWKQVKNAYITVSLEVGGIWRKEDDKSNFCGYHDGSLNQDYTLIMCTSSIAGQFVQLQLFAIASINIYEVEVWGW